MLCRGEDEGSYFYHVQSEYDTSALGKNPLKTPTAMRLSSTENTMG